MEVLYREEYNGYLLSVVSFMGSLNGYITLPLGSRYDGADYDDIPIDIHGGLTFGGIFDVFSTDNWTIGFDTSHFGDNCKAIQNVDYVVSQLRSGVTQLQVLEEKK